MTTEDGQQDDLLIAKKLAKNRILAHQTLFKHRHPNRTPAFHRQMITSWHADLQHILWLVFRGGAKSTIAEEGLIIGAGFKEFRNAIIVGDTQDRAAERLTAIKSEIETNEHLETVFGDLKGAIWGYDEAILSTGIRILAMGRGQSIRGMKHNDMRPDFVLVDDLENEESVATPEARYKTKQWFMRTLLPALDPSYRLRMCATPLDRESLPMELKRTGEGAFETHTYPIEHKGPKGERVATWSDRFSLEAIDKIKDTYRRMGMMSEFNMEYMCEADDPKDKVFKSEMIRVEPQVKTWQATYVMFDPARTIGRESATTGMAAWSWIGSKLVVWEAWGRKLLPDEVVNAIFDVNDHLRPTMIGVEEDGLNEWLMQPIRQQSAKRGITLPIAPVKAPRGKNDFIRGLQPFYQAREVQHAKDLPDLKAQLLSFPSGLIDVPNALAYALIFRLGLPIYDSFGARHIATDLFMSRDSPAYLCCNATASLLTGVLVQMIDGNLRIFGDWVREGEPSINLQAMVGEASAQAGRRVRLVAPPQHFATYTNKGLVQSARSLVSDIRKGVEPDKARVFLQELLEKERRGVSALQVNDEARFTLNGLAGGFARAMGAHGLLAAVPVEGIYRVLMEGLESAVGLFGILRGDDEAENLSYDFTRGGKSYISARR